MNTNECKNCGMPLVYLDNAALWVHQDRDGSRWCIDLNGQIRVDSDNNPVVALPSENATGTALSPLKIYIRWDMNADSWTGTRTMLSIHQTLDGAIAAVPKNIRNDVLERPANDHYVKNYTYEAIEEREIGA